MHKDEEETLIPPYSVCKIRKMIKKNDEEKNGKEKNYKNDREKNDKEKNDKDKNDKKTIFYDFVVDLAFDNSNVNFKNLPIF